MRAQGGEPLGPSSLPTVIARQQKPTRAPLMKSLREPAPPRQSPTTAVDDVLDLGAELANRDPFAGLSGAARELLKAYVVLAGEYAGGGEQPGASWAPDAAVASRIGSSKSTVRRARSELAAAGHLRVAYVPPFHRLPTGEPSLHGTNVVTVLALMGSATDNQKSAPRAVSAAQGASPTRDRVSATTPQWEAASMSNLHEQFSPSQGAALEGRFAEQRTEVVQQIERDSLTPLREEIRSLGQQLSDLRTEMGARIAGVALVLQRHIEGTDAGGAHGAGGAGGGSAPARGKSGAQCAGPDENRVHIMPQPGGAPDWSPFSALPRAA
jgi:hypothetical protein